MRWSCLQRHLWKSDHDACSSCDVSGPLHHCCLSSACPSCVCDVSQDYSHPHSPCACCCSIRLFGSSCSRTSYLSFFFALQMRRCFHSCRQRWLMSPTWSPNEHSLWDLKGRWWSLDVREFGQPAGLSCLQLHRIFAACILEHSAPFFECLRRVLMDLSIHQTASYYLHEGL